MTRREPIVFSFTMEICHDRTARITAAENLRHKQPQRYCRSEDSVAKLEIEWTAHLMDLFVIEKMMETNFVHRLKPLQSLPDFFEADDLDGVGQEALFGVVADDLEAAAVFDLHEGELADHQDELGHDF